VGSGFWLKVFGITGSIGSGKTAVSDALASLGAVVIDADLIAREVVEVGSPGLTSIVDHFGVDVLRSDGALDREVLAARVFNSRDELMTLNSIVHPLVTAAIEDRLGRLEIDAPTTNVVVVVPLLAESDYWKGRFDKILVVDVPDEVALERLISTRGMTLESAQARLKNQASRTDRCAIADIVIDNSGTISDLRERVHTMWTELITEPA
jgi:dephospho-CoA kinase